MVDSCRKPSLKGLPMVEEHTSLNETIHNSYSVRDHFVRNGFRHSTKTVYFDFVTHYCFSFSAAM